jgi:hypothetical protein
MFVQILATVALIAGISAIILEEFRGSSDAGYSSDVNQTIADGLAGLTELTGWLDLIALIVAASIILYLVFKAIGGMGGRGGGGY